MGRILEPPRTNPSMPTCSHCPGQAVVVSGSQPLTCSVGSHGPVEDRRWFHGDRPDMGVGKGTGGVASNRQPHP